jgi:hypothetical protein
MVITTIPHFEWTTFCNNFSKDHSGWLVDIEEESWDYPRKVVFRNMPLEGVSAELKDNKKVISIFLASNIIHILTSPLVIRLEEIKTNIPNNLIISSEEDKKTYLIFKSAVLPEKVEPGSWVD